MTRAFEEFTHTTTLSWKIKLAISLIVAAIILFTACVFYFGWNVGRESRPAPKLNVTIPASADHPEH